MYKPKIALCFSGQLRCHRKLVEHWVQHVILPLQSTYDITVFFYLGHDHYFLDTWDNVLDQYRSHEINVICQTEIDKDFRDIVPKAFDLIPSGLAQGHNQLIREHYFMDQVIKLKREYEQQNNIEFDYVIRSRPDCLPETFNINLLNDIDNNFCISDHDHHAFINGRFTICNSKIADTIFSLIEHYNETIERLPPLLNRSDLDSNFKYFAGEYFWKTHLSLFDINIKLIPFHVYLVRDYDSFFDYASHGHIFLNGNSVTKFDNHLPIPINIVN
jgi:hypothetical protein